MSTALATAAPNVALAVSHEDRDIIRKTYAKDLNEIEFQMLIAESEHRGLDVVKGELRAIKFNGQLAIFPTVHGITKLAGRTGMLDGIEGPVFCGKDGRWVEVWDSDDPPVAAKVIVHRRDRRFPTVRVATWKERKQTYFKDNKEHLMPTWKKMPSHMLGKVAYTDALKASGLIGDEQVWIEEDEVVDGSTIRVVENRWDDGNRHLHGAVAKAGLGGHAEARALAAAVDPEITSLRNAPPSALHTAADIADNLDADYTRNLIEGKAHLTDPPVAVVTNPISNERAIWRGEIEAALPWSKESAQQFMNQARAEPWRFEDLIALSPAPVYLEKFRTAAIVAKVDPAAIQRAERAYHDREQITTERMKSAPLAELTVATWNDLWQVLKVKGIEHASFVDVLGRNTDTFASAQDALTQYAERLASIDGAGADFADVDMDTGEIIDVAVQSPTLFNAADPDRFTK